MLHCPTCKRSVSEGAVRCEFCETELGEPTRRVAPPLAWSTHPARYEPGDLFSGRFKIVERVAESMGVVYKAIDREVGGEVALKLLPDELAALPEYEKRFRREVRVTREINHPNVCRVYDVGVYQSTLYFFMEWVKGETLTDLIRHSRTVEERRALEIAEKVARALEVAHAHGVIHRDIKPSNIMIDERGEVRVMDFGVATEIESDLTKSRVSLGTPEYMAPEQHHGGRADARSDLYSLGLVLQEMLTGERRTAARGKAGAIASRLCAEDPERRYQTASDAAAALADARPQIVSRPRISPLNRRRMAWSLLGLAVGVGIGIGLWRNPGRNPFLPDYLAFYQQGVQYLHDADGVPQFDDAIHMFYRSVQEDSTYALAWAGMGEAYWMRYERTKEQGSRDEAEKAVARAVQINGKLPEVRLAQARGLLGVKKTADAQRLLQDLVKDEPKAAAAWALLGRADGVLGKYEDGLKALRRAIELEPANPRFHVQFGVFYQNNHEYAAAEHEFRRAIELRPDGPTAWGNLGASYLLQNKPDSAIAACNTAIKYEERGSWYANLATAYYYKHDYASAAEGYRHAADLDRVDPTYPENAGDAYRMLGRQAEAESAYVDAVGRARAMLARTPDDQSKRTQLARLYARLNDAPDALAEGQRALKRDPDNVTALFNNAVIRAALGQDDAAVDFLERAVHLGLGKAQILNDPDLSRLRGQPRFERVLALAS
jgi:tetratricopeptide (TPR) repeat protein